MPSPDKQGKGKDAGKCVVLFNSTSSAIKCEKIVKGNGVKVKMIPVPRHLSSDCGICLCFEPRKRKRIEELLTKNNVEYKGIETI